MGQPRRGNGTVTNGINAIGAGFHHGIDLHKPALVERDTTSFETEFFGVGNDADANQRAFGIDNDFFTGGIGNHGSHAVTMMGDVLQFGAGHNRNPALAQGLGQFHADFFVFVRDNPGQSFDQGDFAAKGAKHRGKLDADSAGTDNQQ